MMNDRERLIDAMAKVYFEHIDEHENRWEDCATSFKGWYREPMADVYDKVIAPLVADAAIARQITHEATRGKPVWTIGGNF